MNFCPPLIVFILVASEAAAQWGPSVPADKKVIKTGQDRPTPEYLLEHIEEMEKLPFDGVAIALERPGDGPSKQRRLVFRWWEPQPIEEDVYTENVMRLKKVNFSRFTDNFLWISTQSQAVSAPAWTDDAGFTAIRNNMVLAARLAKDTGLKGIFLDVEQYGGMKWSPWMMRFAYPYAASQQQVKIQHNLIPPAESWEECVAVTRRRGREIMAAMCQVFPEITIVVLPGLHHLAKARIGRGNHWLDEPLKGLASSDYALLAAFGDGLLEGITAQATLVDGYEESYAFTMNKRFVAARKEVHNARSVSAVPDLYNKHMDVGYGLWLGNRYNIRGGWHTAPEDFYANHFTPSEWGNALYFAMHNADRYVWIWNEQSGAVCFPNSGKADSAANVHEDYYAAMRKARQPRRLDTGRDNNKARAMPIPPQGPEYDEQQTFGPLLNEFQVVAELPESWLFLADDESLGIGIYPGFDQDESEWSTIKTNDYLQRQGHRFRGIAWYRCWFDLPVELKDERVHLLFGGVSTNHFYVNGHWLPRERKNGVWIVDFTEQARFGEKNLVALGVVTQGDAGGLYRPVKLAVKK